MDRASVIIAVKALCQSKFGGDQQAMFNFYAKGGLLYMSNVEAILADAEVGTMITRWLAAGEIIEALDTDGDRAITWPEVQAAIAANGG